MLITFRSVILLDMNQKICVLGVNNREPFSKMELRAGFVMRMGWFVILCDFYISQLGIGEVMESLVT